MPIKCMRPHQHSQLQVERRESKCQSSGCTHHTPATGGEREIIDANQVVCAHHTPATGGEERVIEPIKCYALTTHQLQVERRESHRGNQVDALPQHIQLTRGEERRSIEPIKWICATNTPATGGEGERVIESIKCMRSPTHQLQVGEEREVIEPIKFNALTTHSYRWRGERES